MLNKLFGFLFSSEGQGKTNYLTVSDPSFGYTDVSKVAMLLKRKDYAKVQDFYYSLSCDKRTALIEGLCMTEKYTKQLQTWLNKKPDCPVAFLFNGALWTHMAWLVRTGKKTKNSKDDPFKLFAQYLEQAYQLLKTSMDLNSSDADTYARMIRVAKGLAHPLSSLYDLYNKMVKLEPEHLYGHIYMVNALSSKWLGNDEEMRNFAYGICNNLSEGSILYTLIPMVHIEMWMNDQREEKEGFLINYFLSKKVQEDIQYAYKRSVLSGKLTYSQLKPVIHNYFCFALFKIGNRRQAETERNAFGQFMTFYPWAYEEVFTTKQIDAYLGLDMQKQVSVQ